MFTFHPFVYSARLVSQSQDDNAGRLSYGSEEAKSEYVPPRVRSLCMAFHKFSTVKQTQSLSPVDENAPYSGSKFQYDNLNWN